jgi:GMP synthase (glutamine-hydrolysing)
VTHQTVIVLDFGSQYTQLIARRLRELSVYSEIVPHTMPAAEIAKRQPVGIILSGGPKSVSDPGAPMVDAGIFDLGVPVMGICYGMQLLTHVLGGSVGRADQREFGHAMVSPQGNCRLFEGLPDAIRVWASHGDFVAAAPPGFEVTATSANAPVAGMQNTARRIYGILFHPEVVHTDHGAEILSNFAFRHLRCCGTGRCRLWMKASPRLRDAAKAACGLSAV